MVYHSVKPWLKKVLYDSIINVLCFVYVYFNMNMGQIKVKV